MEFTKAERQTLLLAIGTAADKERHAIESLQTGVKFAGVTSAIEERQRYLSQLDWLKKRLVKREDVVKKHSELTLADMETLADGLLEIAQSRGDLVKAIEKSLPAIFAAFGMPAPKWESGEVPGNWAKLNKEISDRLRDVQPDLCQVGASSGRRVQPPGKQSPGCTRPHYGST